MVLTGPEAPSPQLTSQVKEDAMNDRAKHLQVLFWWGQNA